MNYSNDDIFNIPEINEIIYDYKYDLEVLDYKQECELVINQHRKCIDELLERLRDEQQRRRCYNNCQWFITTFTIIMIIILFGIMIIVLTVLLFLSL